MLFYAINGTGLGHLSRQLALMTQAKALCDILGVPTHFAVVTTSDASHVANDFLVYKLPSKSSAAALDVDRATFVADSKLFISNLVAGMRPDVLVMDTVPEGSFQEFAFCRSYAQKTAFVDRHKDEKQQASAMHSAHLKLYDRVLVPDDADAAARHPSSVALGSRCRFVGKVHNVRREDLMTPSQVRDAFAIEDGKKVLYVSAGGGGKTGGMLDVVIDALHARDDVHLLVGYGPLWTGPVRRGPNITPLTSPHVWRVFGGVHGALSAAGYNTYHELLAAQVPSVFYAQRRGMDRQDERVAHGVERGWHLGLMPSAFVDDVMPSTGDINAAVDKLFEEPTYAAVSSTLAKRDLDNGAFFGAVELLRLAASVPGCAVQAQSLDDVVALRSAFVGDDFSSAVQWLQAWERCAQDVSLVDDKRRERVDTADTDMRFAARMASSMRACLEHGVVEDDDDALDVLHAFASGVRVRDDVEERQLRDAWLTCADLWVEHLQVLPWLRAHVRRKDLRQVSMMLADGVDEEPSAVHMLSQMTPARVLTATTFLDEVAAAASSARESG